jgi:hypothetical protein
MSAPDLASPIILPEMNCGSIFTCLYTGSTNIGVANCEAGHPQSAIDLFNTIQDCFNTTCGNSQDDAGAMQPCNGSYYKTDAGVEMCNDCVDNTISGPMSVFNNTMTCIDPSAASCGACTTQVRACYNQCFSDGDCRLLNCATTNKPPTCQNAVCKC